MVAPDRAAALADFLDRAMERRFVWGGQGPDCILNLCDWIEEQRGRDPGEPYRRRYRTAIGARRVIIKAGGLIPLLNRAFRAVGVVRVPVADRQCGDVGVVNGLGRDGPAQWGAIYTGRRWASLLADGGLLVGKADAVAVWRV